VEEQRPHARSTSQGDIIGRAGSNFEQSLGRIQGKQGVAERVIITLGFHPNMPYRPVPGLVALFARWASHSRNPRALHTHSCAATSFSFVEVVRASMERGNFNKNGNRGGSGQQYGGAPPGHDGDQGSMFDRGGVPTGEQCLPPWPRRSRAVLMRWRWLLRRPGPS
jgi:hypothetical protein